MVDAGPKGKTKITFQREDALIDDIGGTQTKYLNGLGIDNKLRTQTGNTVGYFLADHLGSTSALTDASGNVTASNSYDSFGNPTNTNFPSRYQFTGREFDSVTGLQFSRARWYDPTIGRFISEDGSGLGYGINLYGYVANDVTNLADPTGNDGCKKLPNGRCAPTPREPSGPGEPPRRPPRFITEPPTPTPTPVLPPSVPPIVSSPPIGTRCACETAIPRMPDFYTLSLHGGIPQTGGTVGIGVNISVDRHGNFYWTFPSVSFGLPSASGASLTGGWLLQKCKPTEQETNNFLTSWGGSITGFTPWGIGGGYARSSGGQAILLGAGYPMGGSVSGGYGVRGLPW